MGQTNIEVLTKQYNELEKEKNKYWKDLYQWPRVTTPGNTEIISQWLLNDFDNISWSDVGLRTGNFKISDHKGYAPMPKKPFNFTEKQYVNCKFPNEF